MGNHRAERRVRGRGPSQAPTDPTYVGRRVARSTEDTTSPAVAAPVAREAAPALTVVPVVRLDTTHHFNDLESTAELPLTKAAAPVGKRKAIKHAGSRGPLFKGLPSAPILVGVATLAISVGGAITSAQPELASSTAPSVRQASALSGVTGTGTVTMRGGQTVSRDSSRQALEQATDGELVEAAEAQAAQRSTALGELALAAEEQADKIAQNLWVLPLNPSVITATFGEYGLWSSYHTGLDFNGETGDPIMSIANGTVTSAGFDGAYGNKTVVTLEDGTELWYCHQSAFYVQEGDTVRGGDVIGAVGTTGNVTGSHLHVEVRPGGGDPVDPQLAFEQHGVTP